MDAPARGALRFGGVQGHSEGEGSHAGSQGDEEVMEMSGPDLEMVRSHGDTQGHVEMMRSCGDNQGHREMIRVTWRWSGHNATFQVTAGTIFIGLSAVLLDPSQDGCPSLWGGRGRIQEVIFRRVFCMHSVLGVSVCPSSANCKWASCPCWVCWGLTPLLGV